MVAVLPIGAKDSQMLRHMLIHWYTGHAELYLQDKVERYAKIVGVETASVGIKYFKCRWAVAMQMGKSILAGVL